ncbi:AAA family ATPase [Pyrococcus kukulkanii]|uniref:ATPase n=1 Tax=Pyrococcus kukulkanii TaxID=1609559 RepID=A0A127BAL6_9EURY|nr:ATP-binding protein [Pyrococcus kukulkanii]AMM54380.1 ATPase [Pyrococcus kukulkanii]
MYFDPKPKERREDLYDRDKELGKLIDLVKKNAPIIVVKGIRRVGKTSLVRVALNESQRNFIIVDLRGINPNSRRDLVVRFQMAINEALKRSNVLKRVLASVREVEVSKFGVTISWRRASVLEDILLKLQDERFVVVLDEVQDARGPVGKYLASVIAHFYDYGDLPFILTGSQIGLLYDFLGVEDPRAPLYGRFLYEVEVSRFTREQSLEFLRLGFSQLGLDAEDEMLEKVVEVLDGIPGWLVHFGLLAKTHGASEKTLEMTLSQASRLALGEFNEFLKRREVARRRYEAVMKAIANGKRTWSEIKRELEKHEGKTIADSVLSRVLEALVKASFLEKIVDGRNIEYKISDPVLEYALKRGSL